ncbi:MAG TPA: hypothetical protein VI454_11935 [Verrucomicrobiae bacterium]|jgi:Arc/MetJ-type ribon-helix-helix transcriptional regulator
MAQTLNVSFADAQIEWLREKKAREGFTSDAEVVRELVRRLQQAEAKALREEFDRLDADGSDGPEPEAAVVKLVRQVKRKRHAARRRA